MLLKGIKNILFDLGGVLLNLDFKLTQQAFEQLGVNNFNHYYTKAQQIGFFDLLETGKIDESAFCSALKDLTQVNIQNIDIVKAWNAMLLNFPYKRKELLLNLNNHFSTSLLSNTNEIHLKAFNKIIQKDIGEASLHPLFQSCYFSHEIGYRKPNKDAFNYVLEQNNYSPSETLFLDDSIQHIQGAQTLGIKTYHINKVTVEELFFDFLT